jgi:hypothetical protein
VVPRELAELVLEVELLDPVVGVAIVLAPVALGSALLADGINALNVVGII